MFLCELKHGEKEKKVHRCTSQSATQLEESLHYSLVRYSALSIFDLLFSRWLTQRPLQVHLQVLIMQPLDFCERDLKALCLRLNVQYECILIGVVLDDVVIHVDQNPECHTHTRRQNIKRKKKNTKKT